MVAPGDRLGNRYRVVELLGAGGMGEVWAAIDEVDGGDVALKVLGPEAAHDLELVGRFVREARAAERVRHPNVVALRELVVPDDGAAPFMVLERVRGETLEARLARAPLTPEDCGRVGVGVLDALSAVHAEGVVHRDVKPSNVLLVGGSAQRPKLIDFGVAKLLGERGLTRTGTMVGTPVYMAPEQIREEPVDARTDVYGVGATLYELLTGRPPFVEDGARLYRAVLLGELTPLRELRPTVDPELASIVHTALAKDPGLRFESASAMRDRLAGWLEIAEGRATVDRAPPREIAPPRAAPRPRRLPLVPVAIAALLVATGAGALVAFATAERRPARRARDVRILAPRELASAETVPSDREERPAPSGSAAASSSAPSPPSPRARLPMQLSDVGWHAEFVEDDDAERVVKGFRAYVEAVAHPIAACIVEQGGTCRGAFFVTWTDGAIRLEAQGVDCYPKACWQCMERAARSKPFPAAERATSDRTNFRAWGLLTPGAPRGPIAPRRGP